MERYLRQIALPEIGEQGQRKIQNAKVLIVGVGGLGSPVALYLAAAGVGTLHLVDADVVSLSNLGRQILYNTTHVGKCKVEIAKQVLQDLNPDVQVVPHNVALYKEIGEKYSIDLIASGGVSSIRDVEALAKNGTYGAIIGKAYYIGAIDLREAIEVAK